LGSIARLFPIASANGAILPHRTSRPDLGSIARISRSVAAGRPRDVSGFPCPPPDWERGGTRIAHFKSTMRDSRPGRPRLDSALSETDRGGRLLWPPEVAG
jgi:hypothetical protein